MPIIPDSREAWVGTLEAGSYATLAALSTLDSASSSLGILSVFETEELNSVDEV